MRQMPSFVPPCQRAACMQAAYRSFRRGYVSTYELQDPRGAPTRFLEHRMF